MTTFTSGAVLALTLDQDDRLTFVGSGSCTVTPTYGSSWVIRLDAPGTVIGPFRQNVSLSITTTRDGSYTTDNYGDQPTYVTATTNSVTGGISLSAGGSPLSGEDFTEPHIAVTTSYVGTGVSRSIDFGFRPDFVLIKGSGRAAVIYNSDQWYGNIQSFGHTADQMGCRHQELTITV